ncbi:MAG: sodium:solute symporter [Alphaproteobacteria bacterium BRH_c36]|nr:MAG: sodium:solute symporter [Alphaproteobacteria bacterium BRH_c36]
MTFTPRGRLINPRLGIYFGIFASGFISLVLMLLMFEQMGVSRGLLSGLMLGGALSAFLIISVAGISREPIDFFAAGRRVPAVYCGLGLAVSTMGATGMACLAGAFFLIGFDAIWIMSGGFAGYVVMAVLLAPFLRKFGAFTVPTYLGRRFDSRNVRIVSAALFSVPTLLILAAEIGIGAKAVDWLLAQGPAVATAVMVLAVICGLVFGGMRALTWTGVATGVAALLALVVPVAIIAVLLGYLPLPQLSHGPMIRGIGRSEAIVGMPIGLQPQLGLLLPFDGFQPVFKRIAEPFGAIGPLAYSLATLSVMMGVAAAPWILPRIATTPGVYEARKALGWACFFFGSIMLTLITIAVFMREYLMQAAGSSIAAPPDWLRDLVTQRFAQISTRGNQIGVGEIAFDRDSILLALPHAAGLPEVFANLAAVGILAAAFAAASAAALTLAAMLSEDIVNGLNWQPPATTIRLIVVRVMIVIVVSFGGLIAVIAHGDALKLLLWALALTASAGFPVLVASIWWKRVNQYGAFAGIVTGFAVAILMILASESRLIELSSVLAAIVAVPAGVAALVTVSLLTLPPTRHSLELVRDVRVPGGEILYDREMRILRQKERRRT